LNVRQDLERVLDGGQLVGHERQVAHVHGVLDLRRQRAPVVRLFQRANTFVIARLD
jgi:hypothetical protein